MAIPNSLEMTCDRCKVAGTCPARGSSPLVVGGVMRGKCRLIGGYGRSPVDPAILSPESLEAMKRDGDCLTLAHVPRVDEASGVVVFDIVKVFSTANGHPREKTDLCQDAVFPRSHS